MAGVYYISIRYNDQYRVFSRQGLWSTHRSRHNPRLFICPYHRLCHVGLDLVSPERIPPPIGSFIFRFINYFSELIPFFQSSLMRLIGFALFILSDNLIIFNRMSIKIPHAFQLIYVTYYTAQLLIFVGNYQSHSNSSHKKASWCFSCIATNFSSVINIYWLYPYSLRAASATILCLKYIHDMRYITDDCVLVICWSLFR